MIMRRPLSLVVILCLCAVCVSVVGALVCQNNEKCQSGFDLPIAGLSSAVCVVCVFALFYVEGSSMGMGGGMR